MRALFMQKHALKKILLTCLFTFLVLAFLPAQISWAGQPAQSVPTAGPSPTPNVQNPQATAVEPKATAADPQVPATETTTPVPAGTLLAASPTPRVFPTTTKIEPNQNTASATQTAITGPEKQSTPTPETVRPIAASLTAVVIASIEEKTAGEKTIQLYRWGLPVFFVLLVILLGIFILLLRRGKR
jgi:hypothetical protein